MAEIQCSTCNAIITADAKFCPECGSPLKAIGPKKPTSKKRPKKKPVKKGSRVSQTILQLLAILGRAIVNALDWFLIVALMPMISVWTSHSIGTIAAWLAGAIAIACAAMIFRPLPVPMGNTKTKAKAATVMMLIGAMGAYYYGQQADELADLKDSNVAAYLQKLREYRGENRWLEAVKELTPESYAMAVAQLENEKIAVQQNADRDVSDKRFQDALKALRKRVVASAHNGYFVTANDLNGRWHLTPKQIKLRCELGPLYNGKPRPLVVADVKGTTYALNGAAISTGRFENGDSLALNGDTQTVNDLVPIGVAMCAAREETECGTDALAYGLAMSEVKRRLKNPDGADFVSSEIAVAMESCGNWAVKSAVDATNGFGAIIRTHFAAEVRRTPDGNWMTQVYFKQ